MSDSIYKSIVRALSCATALSVVLALASQNCFAAEAKKDAMFDAQNKLMQEINDAQKSGKISAGDAKDLRKRQANLTRKKNRMKEKNRGELSEEDKKVISEELDKSREIMTKMHDSLVKEKAKELAKEQKKKEKELARAEEIAKDKAKDKEKSKVADKAKTQAAVIEKPKAKSKDNKGSKKTKS